MQSRTIFAILFTAALACTPPAPSTPPAADTATSESKVTVARLAEALRAAGLRVEDAGIVEQPFFGVPAHVLRVEQGDVQIYEFRSVADAEAAAAQVAPNGSSIGTTMMSWMAPPHFFRKDSVIVNYLGSDARTLAELWRRFGPQFAGR